MAGRDEAIAVLYPKLQAALAGTGIDPRIALAQFLQETGGNLNRPGNGIFNIIKGSGWSGPTVTRGDATDGRPGRTQEFRAYGSIDEAVADYARMISTAPRYAGLRGGTLEQQAAALGKSGYAEDPNYGASVLRIAQGLPPPGNMPAQAAAPPAQNFNGIPGGVDAETLPWGGGYTPAPQGVVSTGGTAPAPAGNLSAAMQTAISYQGMNETANKEALGSFMAEKGIPFTPDNVAWCARFVNSSLAANGMAGTGSNMARSFMTWGRGTDAPTQGDIAVFSRGDPKAGTGHVGFYGGTVERDGQQYIRVFGGNQGGPAKGGGEAGWTEIPASRLLGYRTAGESAGEAPPAGVISTDAPAQAPTAQTPPAAPVAPYSAAPNSDAARMLSDPTRYGLSPEAAQAMREQMTAGGPGGGTIGNIPVPRTDTAPAASPQPPPAGVLSTAAPPENPAAVAPPPGAQGTAQQLLFDWRKKQAPALMQGGWT
jgi:uncharacterized protein (TIGR02594 family)